MFDSLVAAFGMFFNLYNFFFIFAGVFMGLIMSAIPGLTGIMAIALVIPLTYYMPPVPAIAMLLGAYKGSNIGGAFPAILLNTPGTPDAAPTTLDGFPLAKKGKAFKAMEMATYASVSADIISDTFLVLIAPPLAYIAIKMGPVEMTGLLCFAMLIIILVAGESMIKGLISAGVGLLLGTVGLDPITASERFCFTPSLDEGFSVIPMLIGLFAISEVLVNAELKMTGEKELIYKNSSKPEDNRVSLKEMKKSAKTIGISSLIGTTLGAIPGIGPTIAAFVSYARAKNMSPNPENYGKGELNGVAATQAGNSAVGGANLIPLLSLGIPGDVGAAVLLGAFMLQGLHPGPLLFSQNMDIILSLFMSLFAASLITLVLSIWFIRIAGKVSKIPKPLIFSAVMVFCIVGAYGINQNMFDVYAAFGFGVVGYIMKKLDFSAAALLIAFILEPMLESAFRGSMILSRGSYMIFVDHPIALGLLIATVLCLILIFRTGKQKRNSYHQS